MRRIRCAVLFLVVLSFLSIPCANAADVRVFLLAPMPPHSLKTIETQGSDKPIYIHSFYIPYSIVESEIRIAIKSKADVDAGDQVVKCPSVCPDAHWRVTINTDFSFTQKNQPVIVAFGKPQENGVDISLKTQMRLNINIHARVWVKPATGTVEKTVDTRTET